MIDLGIEWEKQQKLVKRVGYKSFLGMVVMLWKMNKDLKRLNAKGKYDITLPVRWI